MVGTRKAGTTWLYQNFLADPEIAVSPLVKESRFFLGAIDGQAYNSLFTEPGLVRLEVDTALCYEDEAIRRIRAYTDSMRVLLVLREPVSFAVSRFIHAIRKGELPALSIDRAISEHPLFRSELNYPDIIRRFQVPGIDLLKIRYESLADDPVSFYRRVRRHLTCLESDLSPRSLEPKNVARVARIPLAGGLVSRAATAARGVGLHRLVNATKALPFFQRMDRPARHEELAEFRELAQRAVEESFPESMRLYAEIE